MTLACSTIVLASAVSPLIAHPTCASISMIFSIESESSRGDCVRFSTARTTPCEVWIPTVVEPSLMASMAYSTGSCRGERGRRGLVGGGRGEVEADLGRDGPRGCGEGV